MPERTTAKNAADGSVDFGTIEFTLDDLNRALGVNDQTAIANADKPKRMSRRLPTRLQHRLRKPTPMPMHRGCCRRRQGCRGCG